MTEFPTANLQLQANIPQNNNSQTPQNQVVQYPRQQTSGYDVYWRKEKRKNTGLIERLYNKIKNVTGLGIGSKKVEADLIKVNRGEISQNDFVNTVKKYNSSQETSAQTFADLFSIGAAGLTYFGLRNEAKLHHAGKKLNEKFGSSNKLLDAAESAGGGLNLKTFKKAFGKSLAYMAKSKTKLAIFTAGIAAFVGGGVKMHLLQLNRIGSEEFKTNKKDFNGARTPHDKIMYKAYKKEDIKMDDGLFEVLFIRDLKNALELQEVLNALLTKHLDATKMFRCSSRHLHIVCDDEVQWTLDGEDGGSWDEVDLFNHQQVLPIICGDEALEDISSQMVGEPE